VRQLLKILALIPARGGSKGIPMKNLKKIAKKPLIQYTIDIAKKSKIFDKIVVSTDNQKISSTSKKLGADVPFLRPTSLAKDNTPSIKVIKHALNFLEKKQDYVPEIVLLLQPTSPIRTVELIKKSVNLLKKNKTDSVISVAKVKTHPYNCFWEKNKTLQPFNKKFKLYSLRQSLPELYYPTGSIYTFWTSNIKKYDSFYGLKISPLLVTNKEFLVDIDDDFDLFLAKSIINNFK
jgi:CMP-N,N'-diacetyllegionaminic acid synthase